MINRKPLAIHNHACSDASHRHHSEALGHVHAPASFGRAFAVGVVLNGGFVCAEAIYGFRGNSMALLSDAGHNLGDVLGLLAAWTAAIWATKAPTPTHTYGYRRSPVLAALFNAALLLLSTGAIICESVRRILSPEPIVGNLVMAVAGIGIVINLGTALMFAAGSKSDINARGAYIHMLGDACVAFGVVLAGFAIKLTGRSIIDPIVSIVVALFVLIASWKLLRQAVGIAMDKVPSSVDFKEVRAYLHALPGVTDVHDLHIWSMGTSESALTVHLVKPGGADDEFLQEVGRQLNEKFQIGHPTVQVESGEGDRLCYVPCELLGSN